MSNKLNEQAVSDLYDYLYCGDWMPSWVHGWASDYFDNTNPSEEFIFERADSLVDCFYADLKAEAARRGQDELPEVFS